MAGLVVIPEPTADEARVGALVEALEAFGFDVHRTGGEPAVLGAMGVAPDFDVRHIKVLPGVQDVVRITSPYKFASRTWHPDDTLVDVDGVVVGGDEIVVMAGPCSVESEDQLRAAATAVQASGARILRGGVFKPRTSPWSFQGLGLPGLELLARIGEELGLPVVTEVMEPSLVPEVARYADILQIGARNMQNTPLLTAVGRVDRPVLLKRGAAATVDEWLGAADYILAEGNPDVMLCERGIRTFSQATRNTLDLSVVPVLRERTHLPVVVDPSHAVGVARWIPDLAVAAVAAGAHALIVEVHPDPTVALSDAAQALTPDAFAAMMERVGRVGAALGRH
ncbi:MAG: 3-deoxy-7-phosphoheptulonate synthase [Bacteroidota bacterium]